MKKFTKEEFELLPLRGVIRLCPTGDYTDVKKFGDCCLFGPNSEFGSNSDFGSRSEFGPNSEFGSYCEFSSNSVFGPDCEFGSNSDFGSRCTFGNNCRFEGFASREDYPFLALAGAGSCNRTTYFFNTVSGIKVRSACFFGTLDEFKEQVLEEVGPEHIKAIQYLGMAGIAEATFNPQPQPQPQPSIL